MRDRVEDLGILSEKIRVLLESEIFEACSSYNKYAENPYSCIKEFIDGEMAHHRLIATISDIHTKLYEMYQIARWGDFEVDE